MEQSGSGMKQDGFVKVIWQTETVQTNYALTGGGGTYSPELNWLVPE